MHRFQGYVGRVGTEPDRADDAFLLELEGVFKNPLGFDRMPVIQVIHKMDHANIDVVGLDTSQKIVDERIADCQIETAP